MTELFFDHETELITRALLAPPPVCTSWAVDDSTIAVQLWRDTPARAWLEDPSTVFVGANTAYDATVQCAADPSLIPLWVDKYASGQVRDVLLDAKMVAIADGTLSEGRSFSLQTVSAPLGYALEKDDWRLRYAALRAVPIQYWPAGAVAYSAEDTEATRAVHRDNEASNVKWQEAKITVLGQHALLCASAAWVLHLASCHGVCTDRKRTEELAERINAHLDEIRGELVQTGLIVAGKVKALAGNARMIQVMTEQGRRRSITLSDKWQSLFESRTGAGEDPDLVHEQLLGHTERGRGTTKLDRDCAILSGDELLVQRADYVSSKLLLGRVERMRKGHVLPLQTRFDPCKETFRTGSSQPQEPLEGEQMQNFPRGKKEDAYGLRECFTPRAIVPYVHQVRGEWVSELDEGIFIGGDVGQAELCALSELTHHLFGYSKMGELLNAGVDLHWHFAAASRGLTIDAVKLLGSEQRDRAKPANFGFPGGMGVDKFILYSRKGYGVRFERDEVGPMKRKWLETFPEVAAYLEWISDHGDLFTYVHPITGFVRSGCRYTSGANHGFQHLMAYAIKVALVEVNTACFTPGSPLFGWRIWNFIHDEILLEGPRRGASSAALELARIMMNCFNRFCRTFPAKVEPFVMKVWSKKCKSLIVNGEVQEWLPKAA